MQRAFSRDILNGAHPAAAARRAMILAASNGPR